MKLAITKQFQNFLLSININLEDVLLKADINKKLIDEEITLTTLEYYNMLVALNDVSSEETTRSLSDVDNIQMFVPAIFASLSAANGLEAIETLAKFKNLIGPLHLDYLITKDTVTIEYYYELKDKQLPKATVLNEQLLLLSILRKGSGEKIVPLLIESPFDYEEETINLIGTNITLSKTNKMVFLKEHLLKPFITQNNLMYSYLEPELNRQRNLQLENSTIINYVQKELKNSISKGHISIDYIAEKLGVSTRTLQRKLVAEGTTYKEQLQTVRQELALSYLAMNITIEEITYLLAYTEVPAFRRAFKQWTGKTITQYIEEQK